MSKYLAIAMLAIVAVFTIAEAGWWGTVTKTGGDHMGYIIVTAHGQTGNPWVGSSAQGVYRLDALHGMVPGEFYDCVWADTTISGTYYGGHHDGGYYQNSPDVQKDIVVSHPAAYCDMQK